MKKISPPKVIAPASAQQLLRRARQLEPQMLDQLAKLVEIESPSHDKAAVNRAAAKTAGWAKSLGGRVRLHHHGQFGDSVEARFGPPGKSSDQVLLLGHLDTVWDKGTLAHMPWKVSKERLSGPGVLDMKAGVVMMLTAITMLTETQSLGRPVVMMLHGDEEMGSPASRELTETMARQCAEVYVLEPAQGQAGAYKTARKGVGRYRLEVSGVAAHSGVDFSRGHSAVLELAHQIQAIGEITGCAPGTTVNPGLIGGGTRVNVVAADAWTEIDVRISRIRDEARVERALRALRPRDKACKLRLSGGMNRPPMERTPATVALFRRARELAAAMDMPLEEASTGGGSDGNFSSAMGVPTLDGMGAVGDGAHAPHEHCLREHLAPRTALLAAMLL
jgi:glutamate carboxypeptidase